MTTTIDTSSKIFRPVKLAFLTVALLISASINVYSQDLVRGGDGFYLNGQLFTGEHITSYDNGQIESVRNFIKGLEDGVSKYYDAQGNLIELRAWSNGKKHGTWVTYNALGKKTGEANYENDLKHGKWYIWDDNGTLRYEMMYTRGKKTGSWFMWDEQGKLLEEKEYL